MSRRFVYGEEDEPLIQVVGASTKTYLYGDRLGSIFAQAPSTGIVGTKYKYGPFGETASVGAFGFGYTSHRYDTDLLMYFAKARYYSPATGRFVQPDLIGYDDGYNLYTYAQNIPTGFVDMTGLQGETGGDKFVRGFLPIVGPIIDAASHAAVEYLKTDLTD
ncbi:MAG: RHS repeat-associated core domain-containing protein [Candidatus Obscuribacter sp.]|nr:RHS repeat-associated core domain-containing protein [Candidatus Obscuribacter sp.]